MIPPAPLWAAGLGDVIPILIVILFFILSAAGQWIAKMGRQQQPGGRGGRAMGRPVVPQAGGVEDEIGEFLRRAAQRRGGNPPPPPRPRPAPMAEIVEPEVVIPQPVGGQVSSHVGQYLDRGEFDRRTAELGETVARTDQQLQSRLHEVFNHEVSRLATVPGESAVAPKPQQPEEPEDRLHAFPSTAAAGLPVLLSTAENIRQAIVINEILTRPEHRWA